MKDAEFKHPLSSHLPPSPFFPLNQGNLVRLGKKCANLAKILFVSFSCVDKSLVSWNKACQWAASPIHLWKMPNIGRLIIVVFFHICAFPRTCVSNWFFRPPYLIKVFILTICSCINDPPKMGYLNPKTAKSGYFWQNWLFGPKIPPRGAGRT